MLKLKILLVGRPKESWLEEAVADYGRRMQSTLRIESVWLKDDAQLIQQVNKEQQVVCLDPKGMSFTSEGFAAFLEDRFAVGGSRLTMVIGGAEGLPQELKEKERDLISLSPLIFTHQLCWLILVEQIYRAFEILRGSPYHK
jgi:23S rRNA (pseudouridine1915-N3)-methyltransferase